ncbi:MAG: MerR family transcriptional regulator [Anaerolineae bacterium]|jgi:DNA-binding transcriptional MerR regulator|nr:MerR family transcriptional regulator [Anaerolineae bacterium]
MDYMSKDLSQRFDITTETLRQWAMEFRRHLSASANPGSGQHRRFTFADLEVLTLVNELRARNTKWEDIHASLDAGERGIPSIDPAALIPLESQKQLALLYETIERMRGQVSDLEAKLTSANTRADRAEGAQDTLKAQLAEAQERIVQLRIKLNALESDD